MKHIEEELLSGVWSATPTPFTNGMRIDKVAVKRLVEHHVWLGAKGRFVTGGWYL